MKTFQDVAVAFLFMISVAFCLDVTTPQTEVTTEGSVSDTREVVIHNHIACARDDENMKKCPKYSYDFPRRDQTEDYIRVTKPIPTMIFGTVCSWVDLVPGNMTGTWFSYATTDHINSLTVFWRGDGKIDIQINDQGYYPPFRVAGNRTIHLCLSFWVADGRARVYVDGEFFLGMSFDPLDSIKGGGILILGQEQDNYGGGFSASQAYRGSISNFMLWDRPLADPEILDIARECTCPQDHVLDLNHKHLYLNGAVSGNVLRKCPNTE